MSRTQSGVRWPDESLWRTIESAAGASLRLVASVQAEAGLRVLVVEREPLPDVRTLRRRFRLTEREAEVARLLAERPTNRELATMLGISLHTVRRHVEQVLGKLEVRSRNDVRTALLAPASA